MSARDEFKGMGLSESLLQRIEEAGQYAEMRKAAADESAAAERARQLGLSGPDAERFKAEFIETVEAARQAVRDHWRSVIESPEGRSRPKAAIQVAADPDLSTEQAIARLAAMPFEIDEIEAAARSILEA